MSTYSRFIFGRDQSTSMSLVPDFPKVWNSQIVGLGRLIPESRATLYSIQGRVRKLADEISMSELPRIEEAEWHLRGDGLLGPGTALGDFIIRGCQKAKQFRVQGFTGPIGLFLLTDGWSKDDLFPFSVAQSWLNFARDELNVTFRLFGFVHERAHRELEKLKREAGIRPEEDEIVEFYRDEDRTESMILSVERLRDRIYATIEQKVGPD